MMGGKKVEYVPMGDAAVRVELSKADRDLLRVVAAEHGMSMAAFARAVVVAALGEARPESGGDRS
jgi:plasmid stability protein